MGSIWILGVAVLLLLVFRPERWAHRLRKSSKGAS